MPSLKIPSHFADRPALAQRTDNSPLATVDDGPCALRGRYVVHGRSDLVNANPIIRRQNFLAIEEAIGVFEDLDKA
jgi:hypothetical protein